MTYKVNFTIEYDTTIILQQLSIDSNVYYTWDKVMSILLPLHDSWKIWKGTKFGGFAVRASTDKLKFANILFLAHILIITTILYHTTKFKSANTFVLADAVQSTKFNSCQMFGNLVPT